MKGRLASDVWIVSYLTAVTPWPPVQRRTLDGLDFVDRVARWVWHVENVSAPVQRGEIDLAHDAVKR